MAGILLVEDQPDLSLFEADVLRGRGHFVRRCSGGPSMFSACPMLRCGTCPLVEHIDLIIFSCAMFAPIRGRTYRGDHLLRAYRRHPDYGRVAMLVVSVGVPGDLEGSGRLEVVDKFSAPDAVVAAAERMLAGAEMDGGDLDPVL